jgi:hypothetical protein
MTPVLLLVFNRPEKTKEVLKALSKIRPSKLYVSCDGPRNDSDREKIVQIQLLLEKYVIWDVELVCRFDDKNCGCREGVLNGINWLFSQEEEGIILEDDCVPNKIFFDYVAECLKRYRNKEEIYHISGTRFDSALDNSIVLGDYALMWGWATWRNRWSDYEKDGKNFKQVIIKKWLPYGLIRMLYWLLVGRSVYTGRVDTWDVQWMISIWAKNGKSIRPPFNLVENIGFDSEATHTLTKMDSLGSLEAVDSGVINYPRSPEHDKSVNKEDELAWAQVSLKSVLLMMKEVFFVRV